MSRIHTPITEHLGEYIRRHWSRSTPIFERLHEETAKTPNPGMQTAAEQGQFLQFLIRLMGAKRTLEVGVFTGHSSLSVALALPPEGRIVACDVSDHWTSIARRYWQEAGVAGRIDLQIRPAIETLKALPDDESFDLAFIDADKSSYLDYLEALIPHLPSNGLVLVDNTLWGGTAVQPPSPDDDPDTAAIKRFNDAVAADERLESYLLPIADGVTVIRKR